jgi:UDP-glucuronate 4-epimerase
MKVIVTGAAGHVGAKTVQRLKENNFQVIGLDNFSNYYSPEYKLARIENLGIRDVIETVDIREKAQLNDFFKNFQPQKVIHLAARPGVRANWLDISDYNSNNIIGFENILSVCHNHGVEQLIYASSSSVYGDLAKAPFTENSILSIPKSYYALSKMTNEFHGLNYSNSNSRTSVGNSMKLTGLRFFTIYGPWGRPDMATLKFISSALLGEPARLTADLSVARDFTFIDDVVDFLNHTAVNSQQNAHEIYNVCGGKPESLNNLISEIRSFDLDLVLQSFPSSEYDVKMTHGSIEKIKLASFPIPQTSLAVGVQKVVEWARSVDISDLKKWTI